MKDDTLVELLLLKRKIMEKELRIIMEKKIPIWRNIDQKEIIHRIDQVLEVLSEE